MEKAAFESVPINTKELLSKIATTSRQDDKFERVNVNLRKKLVHETTRAILICCLSKNRVFKIDPFKKSLEENLKQSIPPGCLLPLLKSVNDTLIDVFGYSIAPINYGSKRISSESTNSSVKELVLINIIQLDEIRTANNCSFDKTEKAKLFWFITFLYLNNGCEESRAKEHLRLVTGDSITKINDYLTKWLKERYINILKGVNTDRGMSTYEIGLRSFVEIGYQNITKFIMDFEYTDKLAKKWLNDTLGKSQLEEDTQETQETQETTSQTDSTEKEKKEKSNKKETTSKRHVRKAREKNNTSDDDFEN